MIPGNKHISMLLEGCRNNDRICQKKLYELLKGYAFSTCCAYGAYEVEDIAHEAFVKLFRHINSFEEHRYPDILGTLKGWFKKILINTCVDHYRKQHASRRPQSIPIGTDEGMADCSYNAGPGRLSYKDILSAIHALSPGYRLVFTLFVIEGMSHDEIAVQLGISVGTSKSNLSKARGKLRVMLAGKQDGHSPIAPAPDFFKAEAESECASYIDHASQFSLPG